MILPDQSAAQEQPRHFDVTFCGDFREATPEVEAVAAEIAAMRDAGEAGGIGAFLHLRKNMPTGMCADICKVLDGVSVHVLV